MMNWTEERLDNLLMTPSAGMIEDMKQIKGDIMILGAGGKMGPSMATLAKNAIRAAGIDKRIIAVSRFSDPFAVKLLNDNDVETISVDLMAEGAMEKLPDVENIIYMAGRKFGTGDDASPTWAMNTSLPTLVTRRFKGANFVVFSTGNVYPMGDAINLATPSFNCVWQGYANEVAIRSLLCASNPVSHLNVTGPETVSVRYAAELLGKYLGKEPVFTGVESDKAFLNNASRCIERFGYPSVGLNELIRWQAEWLLSGGRILNKPTHFEERAGKF